MNYNVVCFPFDHQKTRRKENQVIIRSIPLTQSKYNTKLEQINKPFKISHINEGKQIWS